MNKPVMLADDATRDPKPQTCSVDSFRRVKRLEDPFSDLCTHPMSGVGNGDADALDIVLPKAGIPRPDEKTTAGFHRVDGISDQVVQNLPNITLITNHWQRAAMAHLYINVGVHQPPVIKAECRFE